MENETILIPPEEDNHYWQPEQDPEQPSPEKKQPDAQDKGMHDDDIDNLIKENETNIRFEKPIPDEIVDQVRQDQEEQDPKTAKPKKETSVDDDDDDGISVDEFADIDLLVEGIDMLLGSGLEMAADKQGVRYEDDDFNASPKQLKFLQKVVTRYAKSEKIKASPLKMMIGGYAGVYLLNYSMVYGMDKKAKKLEKAAYERGRQDAAGRNPNNQQQFNQQQAEEAAYQRFKREQEAKDKFQERTTIISNNEKSKGGRPKGSKDSYKRKRETA